MFRRRDGVEAVVARGSSGEPGSVVGLVHRGRLPRVVAALEAGPSGVPSLAALGPVRELVRDLKLPSLLGQRPRSSRPGSNTASAPSVGSAGLTLPTVLDEHCLAGSGPPGAGTERNGFGRALSR